MPTTPVRDANIQFRLQSPKATVLKRLLDCLAENLIVQACRFGIVGAFALLLDFSVLIVAVELLGWNHLVGASAGYLAGLVLNYALSVRWVFSKRRYSDQRLEFTLFAIIGIGGLGLTDVIIWLCTDLSHFDFRVSKVLAVMCVAVWNFTVRKAWLFSDAAIFRAEAATIEHGNHVTRQM